jgi:hypothetical protein
MNLANLRDMFKKSYKGACKSTIVVSPDTLSPAPVFQLLKLHNTQKRTPIIQNQQMKKIPK